MNGLLTAILRNAFAPELVQFERRQICTSGCAFAVEGAEGIVQSRCNGPENIARIPEQSSNFVRFS
jgi:hypothetical protein